VENGNQIGKILMASVIATMSTLAVGYLTVANKHVTRSEASGMIQIESPYMKDRSLILDKLQTLNDNDSKLSDKLERLLDRSSSSK